MYDSESGIYLLHPHIFGMEDLTKVLVLGVYWFWNYSMFSIFKNAMMMPSDYRQLISKFATLCKINTYIYSIKMNVCALSAHHYETTTPNDVKIFIHSYFHPMKVIGMFLWWNSLPTAPRPRHHSHSSLIIEYLLKFNLKNLSFSYFPLFIAHSRLHNPHKLFNYDPNAKFKNGLR